MNVRVKKMSLIGMLLFMGLISKGYTWPSPVVRVDLPKVIRISDDAENIRIRKVKMTTQVVSERPNQDPCWGRNPEDTTPCDDTIPVYGKVPTIELVYESEEDSFLEGEMIPDPYNPDNRIPSKTIVRDIFLKGNALPKNLKMRVQQGPYQKRVIDEKLSKFCPPMDEQERLGMPWGSCEDKIVYKFVTANGFTVSLENQ